MPTTKKERRINLRASDGAVQTITQASELLGLSLSAFILTSATERAERTLANAGNFKLSPAAWRSFSAALDRPARRHVRLSRLLQEPSILERG